MAPNTKQPGLLNPTTLIELKGLRFLIFDAPSEFQKHNVTDVVRVCDPTYPSDPLIRKGIKVHELPFMDGEAPPSTIVQKWLEIVQEVKDERPPGSTIGIHCVAGLGRFFIKYNIFRAPVLVAIALIENGMSSLDSIQFIREKRRGAINNKQISYIESYKRQSRGKCIIS